MNRRPPRSTLFPYTPLSRSIGTGAGDVRESRGSRPFLGTPVEPQRRTGSPSTRLRRRPTGPASGGTGCGKGAESTVLRITPHPRPGGAMALAIGVDIGGTKVAAGLVDDQGGIVAGARRDTPSHDPARIEEIIADVVRELQASHEVEAVGIGAAGFVDAARSTVVFAPNLAWRDEPLRVNVEKRCGLPVVVENDANAAAWAEARFGAGRGQQYLVVLTVGTGLGGGLVTGGELYRGRQGIAAEFGHVTVEPGGRRGGCGDRKSTRLNSSHANISYAVFCL